jgi:PAS domain-containing protein
MNAQPSPDLEQLLSEFRQHHERLRSLVGPADVNAAPSSAKDLIHEIDEIGERLLVADEELRVQSEELASAQHNLTDVLSAYEHLFMDAPVPYVQTDVEGMIVRNNRAAAQIIGSSALGSSRTMVSLFRLADRGAVRDLLSRVRADPPAPQDSQRDNRPVEVSIEHSGGTVPVVVSAQLLLPGEASALVHWELRPLAATTGQAPSVPPDVAMVVSMATALREVAATTDLPAMASRIIASGRSLVSGADGTALALRRARDRVDVPSASDSDARGATELQRSLREGPAVDTLRTGAVTRTDSLSDDLRWPRLAEHQRDVGFSSVLAVPLVGPRGPFGALMWYSRQPAAFGDETEAIAASFASQTALIYSARELETNLRAGMETRERIGQAVGVLMERHRLTSQQAFDLLVYVSQRTHRKLREIANWVTETGEDPQKFLRGAHGE